jgi:uncharacterized coiled-coil protein SlyX
LWVAGEAVVEVIWNEKKEAAMGGSESEWSAKVAGLEDRVMRLEESLAFAERAIEELTGQLVGADRSVRAVLERLRRLEESMKKGGGDAGQSAKAQDGGAEAGGEGAGGEGNGVAGNGVSGEE